jgi:glycine cleavage system H protein
MNLIGGLIMKVLENLLYTKEHEWIRVDGNKAFIGITDFAQKALGAIVYVELPETDAEFQTGDAFAVIESVKAASDVYAPISGKVLEINDAIVDEPGLLNEDAYENWMASVEITDVSQLDELMNAADYEEFCKEE